MFKRWAEKRRITREPFPDFWRTWIAATLAHWRYLDDVERAQLEDDVKSLLVRPTWEAARGFDLTDQVRVVIAAQAALLVLGLDDLDPYANVETIIVHASTITLAGERPGPIPGTATHGVLPLLGLSQHNGPIVIAWDEAIRNARHPERGHNVVFHEFAHKLDMRDGVVDGTPPLQDSEQVRRWAEVCTREFEELRAGTGGDLLDAYGATDPGEFFAVATEVFFDRPVEMQEEKPELYGVLRDFYRQDPAARLRAS